MNHRGPAIDTASSCPTNCHPVRPNAQCDICTRYRKAPSLPAEQRHRIVIDASTLGLDQCPMLIVQPGVALMGSQRIAA